MNKLYPIATAETRHLFIDPAIREPWFIDGEDYNSREQTSYLKPGKIPNLMELCKPKGKVFSVTEEPDMSTFAIREIIFGMFNLAGDWMVYRTKDVALSLVMDGPATGYIKGELTINVEDALDQNGNEADLGDIACINIPINLTYARATRCLEFISEGHYDNNKPQILGIALDLYHKDSKVIK